MIGPREGSCSGALSTFDYKYLSVMRRWGFGVADTHSSFICANAIFFPEAFSLDATVQITVGELRPLVFPI